HSAGQPIELQPVGTSLRAWSTAVAATAGTDRLRDDLDAWLAIVGDDEEPLGHRALDPSTDTFATSETTSIELDPKTTAPLLDRRPGYFGGGADLGLLAALALAVGAWRPTATGPRRNLLVGLEGHGRDGDFLAGADLARTVGWFTTVYPARLALGE